MCAYNTQYASKNCFVLNIFFIDTSKIIIVRKITNINNEHCVSSTTMKEIHTFFNDMQMRDVAVLVKKQTSLEVLFPGLL